MATAPIISQSVQVELPDSVQSQEVSNEDKVPVILEVAGIGKYAISIGGERQEGLTAVSYTHRAHETKKKKTHNHINEFYLPATPKYTYATPRDLSTAQSPTPPCKK
ncbi:hypothetical protein, partial [Pseudomonas aeruginosa]